MDSRLSKIVSMLTEEVSAISIKRIASLLKVSERTIYTDIKKLNVKLKAFNYPVIVNVGGEISFSEKLKSHIDELKNDLFGENEIQRRRENMIRYIILEKKYFTIEDLCKKFYISRGTALNDIKNIKNIFTQQSIIVRSMQFKGYRLEGDEIDIRSIAIEKIIKTLNEKDRKYFNYEDGTLLYNLENFLTEITLAINLEISDESFERVVSALWVAYQRIHLGFPLEPGLFKDSESKETIYLLKNKKKLEQVYQHNIPDSECRYIAAKLSESSVLDEGQSLSERWILYSLLTQQFIEEVSESYKFSEFTRDDTLFLGIINHLRPAYKRAKMNEYITNPILGYIKEKYPMLHDKVLKRIKILESQLAVKFSEHEVSYFTLLFASSYERNKKTIETKSRVIIVCHAGMSTSEILKTRMVSNFNVDILGTFSARSAKEWLASNDVNLIISTVDFHHPSIPVIVVNPYLSEKDKDRIASMLKKATRSIDIEFLIDKISNHAQILDEDKLKVELSQYFGLPISKRIEEGGYQPMLLEVLNERLLSVNAKCESRDQAVRESGRLLVKEGYAEESYIQAMIDNVEENGTYIVIAPGIAMPHARPEKGAKAIGLSIVTLDKPVKFGHPTNDPVSIVVGLCAVDHQTHLRALSELVDILGDNNKLNKIKKASSKDELMKIIKGGK